MSIYTVHAPPPRTDGAAPDPERIAFIRDGFHFWAFVFGPVWLLLKRLWLALLSYIVVVAALHAGLWLLVVSREAYTVVAILMHLLLGLEAATVQRWTLNRRGWAQLGVVSGRNYEEVERRFFDAWVVRTAKPGAPAASPPPVSSSMRVPAASSDIIGLFPEPQSRQ